jgi:hypothetical protein
MGTSLQRGLAARKYTKYCAGALGTTIHRTPACRTVTGTSHRTVTTISAFGVPGRRSANAGQSRRL